MPFSIIICTYNPEPQIFQRLLNAVMRFEASSPEHEVIVVDNNSTIALENDKTVQKFLTEKQHARLIREPKPGLTEARIAGIGQAKNDWIIFFDDDNEPAADYLIAAASVIKQYPQVGAWGPGNVEVVYLDPFAPEWLYRYEYIFQQRKHETSVFGFEKGSQDYYPDGTGLCIKKIVATEYIKRVQSSEYTLSDRDKKKLTSGGDLQLILTATDCSYAVGRACTMQLKHNIGKDKIKLKYILKLVYGIESCNYIAHSEVLKWNFKKKKNLSIILIKACVR